MDYSPDKRANVVDKLFTNLQMEEEVFCDSIRIGGGNVYVQFLNKNSVCT